MDVRRTSTALILALALAAPALAQERDRDQTPVIVTSGDAEVKRAADRAWVSVNAESRSRDPREAQRLNTQAMSAVMAKLKGMALGEDAIRTIAFELHPEFDYANGRQTLRGYVARNAIEVRVDDVTKVGDVLTAVVGSGATSVGALRFDLKEREAAEREALRLAVQNARARAEAAASGAGMRVDRIIRIEDHVSGGNERLMASAPVAMMAESRAANVPVTPGNLTIVARVSLTVAIR